MPLEAPRSNGEPTDGATQVFLHCGHARGFGDFPRSNLPCTLQAYPDTGSYAHAMEKKVVTCSAPVNIAVVKYCECYVNACSCLPQCHSRLVFFLSRGEEK